MLAAAALAVLLLAPVGAPPAPLDAAACEAIPGAADEGPQFEDPDGLFSLKLPSSWTGKQITPEVAAQQDVRAAFELRQGDVHRLLKIRVIHPNGTRGEDAARLAMGPLGAHNHLVHGGAPCLWIASQGVGHARVQSMICDLKVKDAPERFVIDLIYLDADTCDHGAELKSVVDTLKWGAKVTPAAS